MSPHVHPRQGWRGHALTGEQLAKAVPMMPTELRNLVRLLDLVEDWLGRDEHARNLLAEHIDTFALWPGTPGQVWAVIDDLGHASQALHAILQAHHPRPHPPTS